MAENSLLQFVQQTNQNKDIMLCKWQNVLKFDWKPHATNKRSHSNRCSELIWGHFKAWYIMTRSQLMLIGEGGGLQFLGGGA